MEFSLNEFKIFNEQLMIEYGYEFENINLDDLEEW